MSTVLGKISEYGNKREFSGALRFLNTYIKFLLTGCNYKDRYTFNFFLLFENDPQFYLNSNNDTMQLTMNEVITESVFLLFKLKYFYVTLFNIKYSSKCMYGLMSVGSSQVNYFCKLNGND